MIDIIEAGKGITFGNYELAEKTKKPYFEMDGDIYKVKTFNEITKLERNDMFVYESVPGTRVYDLEYADNSIVFTVEGFKDTSITLGAEANTEYVIYVNGKKLDQVKTNLGGKLNFGIDLSDKAKAGIKIERL